MTHLNEAADTREYRELTEKELLDLLFSYAIKIADEKRLDNLLVIMADLGRKITVSDRCSLWLIDHDKGELWTKVAHGLSEVRVPIDTGFVGHSIRNQESIIIDDAYEDVRFNPEVDHQSGYRTRSVMVIPIKDNDGHLMGVFQAVNKMTAAGVFTSNDLNRLHLTAAYSGKALESALLLKEIEDTQKEIIYTMSEVGESRSKETGNHVKRVAEYCYILAKGCGLSNEDAEMIRLASPMHDIGKIGIPDSILKKPGKLTFEEFEIMKTHSLLGYDMLKNSKRPILKAAALIALQHQEKWDGSGYPNRLKGEEIHIFGRICAIADVFDALSSDRVYKKAWPLDKVLGLFNDEKDKHFEGRLVDIMMQNLDAFVHIKDTYQDIYLEKH